MPEAFSGLQLQGVDRITHGHLCLWVQLHSVSASSGVFLTQRRYLRGWENNRKRPRTGAFQKEMPRKGSMKVLPVCRLHPSQECMCVLRPVVWL